MKIENITIQTKNGNTIHRRAEIVDRIDNNGIQYSLAFVGKNPHPYTIIRRESTHNVWHSTIQN